MTVRPFTRICNIVRPQGLKMDWRDVACCASKGDALKLEEKMLYLDLLASMMKPTGAVKDDL